MNDIAVEYEPGFEAEDVQDIDEYQVPANRLLGQAVLQESSLANGTFYILLPMAILILCRLLEGFLYTWEYFVIIFFILDIFLFLAAYIACLKKSIRFNTRISIFFLSLFLVVALEFTMTEMSSFRHIYMPTLVAYLMWAIHFNAHRNILYIGLSLFSIFGYASLIHYSTSVFLIFAVDILSYTVIFNLFRSSVFSVFFWDYFYSSTELDETVDRYWSVHELVESSLTNLLPARWKEQVLVNGINKDYMEEFTNLVVISFFVEVKDDSRMFNFELLNEIFEQFDRVLNYYPVDKIQTQKNVYTAVCIPQNDSTRFLRTSITHACDFAMHSMHSIRSDFPEVRVTCGITCGPSDIFVLDRNRPTIGIYGEAYKRCVSSLLSCPYFKIQSDEFVSEIISASASRSRYKVDHSLTQRKKSLAFSNDLNVAYHTNSRFKLLEIKKDIESTRSHSISSLYLPGTVLLKKDYKFPPVDDKKEDTGLREFLVNGYTADDRFKIESDEVEGADGEIASDDVVSASIYKLMTMDGFVLSIETLKRYKRLYPLVLFVAVIEGAIVSLFHKIVSNRSDFLEIVLFSLFSEFLLTWNFWKRFTARLEQYSKNSTEDNEESEQISILNGLRRHWLFLSGIKMFICLMQSILNPCFLSYTTNKFYDLIFYKVMSMNILRNMLISNFLLVGVMRFKNQIIINLGYVSVFFLNCGLTFYFSDTFDFTLKGFYDTVLEFNHISMTFSILLASVAGFLYRGILMKINLSTQHSRKLTARMDARVSSEDKTLDFLKGNVIPRFLSRKLEEVYLDRVSVNLDSTYVIVTEISGWERCSKSCGMEPVISFLNDVYNHFDELNSDYMFSKCRILLNRYTIICHELAHSKSKDIVFYTRSLLSIFSIHLNKEKHQALKPFLSLRIGVGQGKVICGIMGPSLRVTVELQGEGYDEAIESMYTCPPNQVKLSTSAQERMEAVDQ